MNLEGRFVMKTLTFSLCLLFLFGCASSQTTVDMSVPQLLVKYPLPTVPNKAYKPNFEIEMQMLIAENGTVSQVKLLNSSGSNDWDSLAVETIKKWRFSPAIIDNKPVSRWIHQKALVMYTNPLYLNLGEILCKTSSEADSVYTYLKNGVNFSELVMQHSIAVTRDKNGELGEVNIYQYSEQISNILVHLNVDEFTKPIQYGYKYIIFKRLSK
jgi:TonB family protein